MGEEAVDAGDHPRQCPEGEADRDEAGQGEGDGGWIVGPVGQQAQGDDDDTASAATAMPQPSHCIRRRSTAPAST